MQISKFRKLTNIKFKRITNTSNKKRSSKNNKKINTGKIVKNAITKKKPLRKVSFYMYWGFSIFIILLLSGFSLGIVIFSIVSGTYLKQLPSVTTPLKRNHSENTLIYSRNGTLIDTIYGNKSREYVPYNQISPYMIKSMIAAEDVHFFTENYGLNLKDILRAAYNDIFNHNIGLQGGSTITQQLVKVTALSNKRIVSRKIRGVLLTMKLSSKYSRKQILQAYLNDVGFGGDIYGIQMAAETYFGIPARDLNLAQSAMLAGLVQAPSVYSPFFGTNPSLATIRQHYVLNQMIQHKNTIGIPVNQINAAKKVILKYHTPNNSIIDPWFIYYLKSYLDNMYGSKTVDTGGLKVYTTLSLKFQNMAQQSVSSGIQQLLYEGFNTHNASLAAINPKNGHILAMVGSANYNENNQYIRGEVNSTLSNISPGSSLKPFVYITAFEKHLLTPNSIVYDTPLDIGGWAPTDWNGTYEGAITAATALLQSRNIPAIRTGMLVGLNSVFQTFRSVGLSQFTNQSINKCGYTAIIGGCDITVLQEAGAYTALANNGIYQAPSPIRQIYNKFGKLIYNNLAPKGTSVFSKLYVEMITRIIKHYYTMAPVINAGYAVAGKTGTSNSHIDNVFAGYSPNLVSVVWAGNDNYTYTSPNTWGETTAAPIWNNFMLKAL
jgi:penicillin-binding protein 1A